MYFESPGKENTAKTIEIATQAIKNYDIRHVVLATTTGYTAQCFPALDGVNVVCIPHAYGFKEPGKNELTDETIQQLREKGFQVYASSHALSGAERGITGKFGGVAPVEIIAHTLRFFWSGHESLRRNCCHGGRWRFYPTERAHPLHWRYRPWSRHSRYYALLMPITFWILRSIKFYANPYSLKFPFDPNKKREKHSVFLFFFLTKYLDTHAA